MKQQFFKAPTNEEKKVYNFILSARGEGKRLANIKTDQQMLDENYKPRKGWYGEQEDRGGIYGVL